MVTTRCGAVCHTTYGIVGGGVGAAIAWWLSSGGSTDAGTVALWIVLTGTVAASAVLGSIAIRMPVIVSSTSASAYRVFIKGALASLVALLLSSIGLGGVEAVQATGAGFGEWFGMSALVLYWAALLFGLPGMVLGGIPALCVRAACRMFA
jgi:hypothetical protein